MFDKITQFFFNHPIVVRLIAWAKATSLPGFQGVSNYNVFNFLISEIFYNPLLMTRANAIAFSFFMSLFPTLIVLFSLIPFLPIQKDQILDQLYFAIQEIMPNKSGDAVFETIKSFIKTKRSDLLSVGFILAIYFASNGLMALMRNFEKNHVVFIKRNIFDKRFRAVGMTFTLGILLFISVIFVILGNQLVDLVAVFFKFRKSTKVVLLQPIRWISVIALVYFGVAVIYRFGVATKKELNFFSPGATVAAVSSILTSIGFSYYVDNFGKYDKLYGSIGAIIVLLLWLQLNAVILIFGFELNAAIAVNRDLSAPLPLLKEENEIGV